MLQSTLFGGCRGQCLTREPSQAQSQALHASSSDHRAEKDFSIQTNRQSSSPDRAPQQMVGCCHSCNTKKQNQRIIEIIGPRLFNRAMRTEGQAFHNLDGVLQPQGSFNRDRLPPQQESHTIHKNSISVHNIPLTARLADLVALFLRFGPIKSACLTTDRRLANTICLANNACTGIVDFDQLVSVNDAIRVSTHEQLYFEGRPVTVSKSGGVLGCPSNSCRSLDDQSPVANACNGVQHHSVLNTPLFPVSNVWKWPQGQEGPWCGQSKSQGPTFAPVLDQTQNPKITPTVSGQPPNAADSKGRKPTNMG